MPHEVTAVTNGYARVGVLAVLAGVICFGLIVLAAADLVTDVVLFGVPLWPVVMGTLIGSIFVSSWAFAKAKGRSGWLGVLLPFLDVVGLAILFKLEDRTKKGHEP